MKKKSKKYSLALEKIDRGKPYSLKEGVSLVKEIAFAKFDESVELSVRLNIEQKHSIRGSISLPVSIGKSETRILVFAQGDQQIKAAQEGGADYVGFEELVEKIKGGWLEFDVAIAPPSLMKDISKLGPILGRKGLMPNPKVGTVSDNLKETVQEFKKGRVEYRANKQGIIHAKIGKVSMDPDSVTQNATALFQEILRKKPSDIKGDYVKSIFVSPTMGPSVKLDIHSLR
jgi:large subunit ribosomal protein L1